MTSRPQFKIFDKQIRRLSKSAVNRLNFKQRHLNLINEIGTDD